MKRKTLSVEKIKARYGYIFLLPWIIGMLLFFLFPIFQSMFFSFTRLNIAESGVTTEFVGIENFHEILYVNPDYINNLILGLTEIFTQLPFIIVVSLILALLLNNNFPGRLFFRSFYFLPVIISSGLALNLFLSASGNNASEVALSDSVTFGMIDFTEILSGLNLPVSIETYLSTVLEDLFMLVWKSGIQIVLFISGLQSIPDSLYEVSKVEGATKWEEFWFITLPMLLRTMLLVIIFTIVEIITSANNPVIEQGYNQFSVVEYGLGSAMLWFYFVIVGAAIAVILLLYNKLFLKRWS